MNTWLNASTSTAHFEVYRDLGGMYRWRLKAGNGATVASSGESFASEYDARRAATNVKTLAGTASVG